jgi:hypothetical protein
MSEDDFPEFPCKVRYLALMAIGSMGLVWFLSKLIDWFL